MVRRKIYIAIVLCFGFFFFFPFVLFSLFPLVFQ